MNSTDFPVHPAANVIPKMSEEEYANLKQDIATNGQCEDIVVWEGQLLDGRHRLRACQELGIEPKYFELCENVDPWTYAISRNLHRRHLTTGQRSMIAAQLATLKNGSNQHNKEGGPNGISIDKAAKTMSVSAKSVKRPRTIAAKAPAEVTAAVESGKLTLGAATKRLPQKTNSTPALAENEKQNSIIRMYMQYFLNQIDESWIADGKCTGMAPVNFKSIIARAVSLIGAESVVGQLHELMMKLELKRPELNAFANVVSRFLAQVDPQAK
jgi:hypothetical protein